MNHVCNPFCQGGIHAILTDPGPLETPILAGIGKNLARSYGLDFRGLTEVRDDALLGAPGTPTKYGATRGRFIVWATRPGE